MAACKVVLTGFVEVATLRTASDAAGTQSPNSKFPLHLAVNKLVELLFG